MEYKKLGDEGVKIDIGGTFTDPTTGEEHRNCYHIATKTVYCGGEVDLQYGLSFDKAPPLAVLAHELEHGYYDLFRRKRPVTRWEIFAVLRGNKARYAYFEHWLQTGYGVYPRVSYTNHHWDLGTPDEKAWKKYWARGALVRY